jgi:hypothetical protein
MQIKGGWHFYSRERKICRKKTLWKFLFQSTIPRSKYLGLIWMLIFPYENLHVLANEYGKHNSGIFTSVHTVCTIA